MLNNASLKGVRIAQINGRTISNVLIFPSLKGIQNLILENQCFQQYLEG